MNSVNAVSGKNNAFRNPSDELAPSEVNKKVEKVATNVILNPSPEGLPCPNSSTLSAKKSSSESSWGSSSTSSAKKPLSESSWRSSSISSAKKPSPESSWGSSSTSSAKKPLSESSWRSSSISSAKKPLSESSWRSSSTLSAKKSSSESSWGSSSTSSAKKTPSESSWGSSSTLSAKKPLSESSWGSSSTSSAKKSSSESSWGSSSISSAKKPLSESSWGSSFTSSFCSKLKDRTIAVQEKVSRIECNGRAKSAALITLLSLIALANTSYISDTSTQVFDTSVSYACSISYIRPYMPNGWCGGVLDQIFKVGGLVSGFMDNII